nr:hypothetical protein [Microbacterium sp. Se63.02b]
MEAVVAAAERDDAGEWSANLRAIADVAKTYPRDPGVVVALLMNHVVLRRGDGLFLRAGLLHAYLSGLGVEIMAASDNVLRGGLTPKRIDVPELLAILDTSPGEVPVLRPAAGEVVTEYPVPVPDFALTRITLDGDPVVIEVAGPTMVLATAGSVVVTSATGRSWRSRSGRRASRARTNPLSLSRVSARPSSRALGAERALRVVSRHADDSP